MRAFRRSQPQCINPRFQCQLGHVNPGHAFLMTMCIFMLPMAVIAAEHTQLTMTEPVILFGRWCIHPRHMSLKHTPLKLPSLSNILPVMALQNEIVKSNIWCLSCSTSHASVRRVSFSPGFSVPSGLVRMVVGAVVVLLLLMSGDIETNPGPVGECITKYVLFRIGWNVSSSHTDSMLSLVLHLLQAFAYSWAKVLDIIVWTILQLCTTEKGWESWAYTKKGLLQQTRGTKLRMVGWGMLTIVIWSMHYVHVCM